jgi:zinc/manganese transport system substrate-binding protein
MKKLVLAVLLALPSAAQAKLRIVATLPELADMTRRVGGDRVTIDTLARGTEDIHQVVMRPSFVSKLNRADAVVFLGLGAEHSFLPALVGAAANPKMRLDWGASCLGEGCIDLSEGVEVLDKPQTVSRAEGELHPQGNPHYNLGADNGPRMARNVAAGLSRVDPDGAAEYEKNLDAYLKELDAKLGEWRKLAAPLKGLKAVSYHRDVAYLGKFTGIQFVEAVEFKPGVPPTPKHLESLAKLMKEKGVKLIVREQHFETKSCDWLAQRTGAKIAVIGVMAGSLPGTDTWVKLIDANLRALAEAAR